MTQTKARSSRARRTFLPVVRGMALLAFFGAATASCAGSGAAEGDVLAFTDVGVVDGTGGPTREHWTVIVRGDTIADMGPASEITVPRGAEVVDGRGRYLMPGLIDMHVHLSKTRGSALAQFLVHGVTSVRDCGGDWEEIQRWRDEIRAGERAGPRIRAAGPYIESVENVERMRAARARGEMVEPVEHTRIPVGSPERARAVVDSIASLGVDFIKFRTVSSLATYQAIVSEADSVGLYVAGHTYGIPLPTVVRTGQKSIEHFIFPVFDEASASERAAMFREMADSGTVIVPTLVTWDLSVLAADSTLEAEMADTLGERWPERPYLSRYLELDWQEQFAERGGEGGPDWEAVHRSTLRNLREMRQAGVTILPGTDVAVIGIYPGASLHDELQLFVRDLGMSPGEAIQAATSRAAGLLGLADSVGTIARGKQADLVLLSADPTQDIANTRRIEAVVSRGRLFRRGQLDSLRAAGVGGAGCGGE